MWKKEIRKSSSMNGYFVSDLWNVISMISWKERMLSKCSVWNGYLCVYWCENKKRKTLYIHRLVAEAFCKKEWNRNEVNHKDRDKTNNTKENLERVTRRENNQHAFWKPIWKYSLDWKLLWKYMGCRDAERKTWALCQLISRCCLWKQKQTWWYMRKFI